MVHIVKQLIGVSLALGLASAAPLYKRDSSSGVEVAVSAPDGGAPTSDSAELSSQLGTSTADLPQTTSFSDDGIATIGATDIPTDVSASGSDGASVEAPAPTVVAPPPSLPPSSSSGSYNYPVYGSGSSSWMTSYNSCVQTCMAQYPPPPTTYTPPSLPPSSDSGSVDSGISSSAGSSSSGDIIDIVVAPHKGVLRYVPPFVTAQVGQTVRFTWGAGPHTVTRSSQATPCNHTIGGFQSGQQNASFVFTQTVNDTDPIFFYCGVPSHCQKGMFGAINAPTAAGANTSVAAMMPMWASMDADIMAAMTALNTTLNTTNSLVAVPSAATWGNDIDVGGIDPSFHVAIAKDILYTRSLIAANPKLVKADGTFSPTTSMNVPADLSAYLDSANAGSPSGAANAGAAPTTSDAAADSSSGTAASPAATGYGTNGAASVKASGAAVALAAVVAAFFAL